MTLDLSIKAPKKGGFSEGRCFRVITLCYEIIEWFADGDTLEGFAMEYAPFLFCLAKKKKKKGERKRKRDKEKDRTKKE